MPIDLSKMVTAEQKQQDQIDVIVAQYRDAIQSMIDRTANERQYDDGSSLASYVNSTIPEWANEAQAFVVWRDQVWAYAIEELAKVQNAEREQPNLEDSLDEIPSFNWPNEYHK